VLALLVVEAGLSTSARLDFNDSRVDVEANRVFDKPDAPD